MTSRAKSFGFNIRSSYTQSLLEEADLHRSNVRQVYFGWLHFTMEGPRTSQYADKPKKYYRESQPAHYPTIIVTVLVLGYPVDSNATFKIGERGDRLTPRGSPQMKRG